jgi:hypothetical protein
MNYFDPIDNNLFKLGDLGTFANRDITDAITAMSVSLTMDGSSEVSVSVVDVDFMMAKNNYFQIRRDIFYRDIFFELTAVSVSRGDAIHPQYDLECRSKAVQLMKQDKRPEAFNGLSGFDLAQRMAKRYNMHFFGEKTTKKQAVVKARSKTEDDSVWTVLQSLAGEQEFVCFESQNTLFFTSEKYLLGKWGDPNFVYGDLQFIPFIWPEPTQSFLPEAIDKYVLLDMPSVRRSDDDIKAAQGSIIVDRANGVKLRPGMTIFLGGIPDFEGLYLITDVAFDEGSVEPVQVQFRTPVEPKKERVSGNIASGGSGAGGGGSGGGIPDSDDPLGGDPAPSTLFPGSNTDRYTASVLARTNYTGSNASVILTAVSSSVTAFRNGRPNAEIEKTIRASQKLTTEEKDLVIRIYQAFSSGASVTQFAVAGGLSTIAINQRRDNFLKKETPPPTIVTPAQGIETATTGGTLANFGTSSIISPSQTLPSDVAPLINSYIAKNRSPFNKVTLAVLQSTALRHAGEIFGKSTKTEKIKRYVEIKKLYENKFDYRDVFNALRQQSVISKIVAPLQGGLTFEKMYPGMPKAFGDTSSDRVRNG